MYRWVIRPLLFLLPAEAAHQFAFALLRISMLIPFVARLVRARLAPRDPALTVRALGCTFPSPVLLAAGFDKDAAGFGALAALGFGGIEVGTITSQAQPGNPRPRLFRLPLDRALINRMGFNNRGAAAAAARLSRHRPRVAPTQQLTQPGPSAATAARAAVPIGVNIGKTKVVPSAEAPRDYAKSAALLAPHADYLVVNVSSPNTPGLRDLQAVSELGPLLESVQAAIAGSCGAGRRPALLVKIAPDLADEDIDHIADLALEMGLDGIIATNTTISREGLVTPAAEVTAAGAGGLSGAPLRARALEVLRRLRHRVGERLVLVAAGGIGSADDAWERIRAGATLVQVYTGFIYEGPAWPSRLARALSARARAEGFERIEDAVGSGGIGQQDRHTSG